jgi:hypothetical protein
VAQIVRFSRAPRPRPAAATIPKPPAVIGGSLGLGTVGVAGLGGGTAGSSGGTPGCGGIPSGRGAGRGCPGGRDDGPAGRPLGPVFVPTTQLQVRGHVASPIAWQPRGDQTELFYLSAKGGPCRGHRVWRAARHTPGGNGVLLPAAIASFHHFLSRRDLMKPGGTGVASLSRR